MQLYDKQTINQLEWPDNDLGRYAKSYLFPMINDDPNHFVNNVQTTVQALSDRELVIPITINDAEYDNSYVCSPFGQYINYGLDEMESLVSKLKRPFMKGALHCLGSLLKAGQINKAVHVNNWLLSTNLYPHLNPLQIQEITDLLTNQFPEHALIFRSINQTEGSLLEILKSKGYSLVFSRLVFLIEKDDPAPIKERHFKKDVKLLESSGYEVIEHEQISLDEAARIASLYQALNIEKHSRVNPLFTEEFTKLCLQTGTLKFRGLKKDGVLDAVYGAVHRGETMVAPFFGYDTTKPEELGLYRQLSALAVLEARESKRTLNQSGGASSFKKRRKAKPVAEYHAVYTDHLPKWRQAPWQTLKQIGDRFIAPFVSQKNI